MKKALQWISSILLEKKIPFRVARLSPDKELKKHIPKLEVEVSFHHLNKFLPDIKDHMKSGVRHFQDEEWDLFFIKLNYEGHEIALIDSDRITRVKHKKVPQSPKRVIHTKRSQSVTPRSHLFRPEIAIPHESGEPVIAVVVIGLIILIAVVVLFSI